MTDETSLPSTSCDNQQLVEETESLNFLDLPRDVQLLICSQLDLSTYINLLKTSKDVRRLKLTSKTLLFEKEVQYVYYNDSDLRVSLFRSREWDPQRCSDFSWDQLAPSPVTIVTPLFEIKTPLTDRKFKKLAKLFKAKRLKTNSLLVIGKDLDYIENVLNLMDIVKPLSLSTNESWPDNFFLDDRLKSVTSLHTNNNGCSEEAFLLLNIPQDINMFGTTLTNEFLRKFLMQLYEGTRYVNTVFVGYDNSFFDNSDEYELMTDILIPIWTKATHHLSLLKDYPLSEVEEWNMPQMFYLFPRDSKELEYYHIEFYEDYLEIHRTDNMYYGYSRHLNFDVASKLFPKK